MSQLLFQYIATFHAITNCPRAPLRLKIQLRNSRNCFWQSTFIPSMINNNSLYFSENQFESRWESIAHFNSSIQNYNSKLWWGVIGCGFWWVKENIWKFIDKKGRRTERIKNVCQMFGNGLKMKNYGMIYWKKGKEYSSSARFLLPAICL